MHSLHVSVSLLVSIQRWHIGSCYDDWCQLPGELGQHLDRLQSGELTFRTVKVVKCFRSVHELFVAVCEGLRVRPSVQQAFKRVAVVPQRWRRDISAWATLQRSILYQWTPAHPDCARLTRMLVSAAFLRGLAGHFDTLADDAIGSQLEGHVQVGWLNRFQSMWLLAVHYSLYLQMLSFDAFDSVSDVAQSLHKIGRADSTNEPHPQFSIACDGAEASDNATNATLVRRALCRKRALLRHDELSGSSVFKLVEARSNANLRSRVVEVGVFQANLSGHIWDRVVRRKGPLELHLVDHWGRARKPIDWSWKDTAKPAEDVGTGSDMAGQSNETTLHNVWSRFQRQGANCVEVPYWLPEGMSRTFVDGLEPSRNHVVFHRTTTVEASRSFNDDSLDVVYIDGDHKWWSVLQDLAAWWPKVKPGGVLMGHDFHFNPLMEREGAVGGDSNDVPMAVMGFFRAPLKIELHPGFVWSVQKRLRSDEGNAEKGFVLQETLCKWLRNRMAPHWMFEICID